MQYELKFYETYWTRNNWDKNNFEQITKTLNYN